MSASEREHLERQFTPEEQEPTVMETVRADILERLAEGFNAFDRDWRFIYVNRAAEEMLGWSRHELLGRRLWDVYPTLIGTRAYREYQRAMSEQIPSIFGEYHAESGRWFEFRAYPSPSNLHVYFRDVTAQRRWFLEEPSHGLALAESTPDRVARFDRDGRYLYVNPALLQDSSLTEQDFLGKTSVEVGLPALSLDRDVWDNTLLEVITTGETVTRHFEEGLPASPRIFEVRFVPEYESDEVSSYVSSILAISRDVTDQTKAQETLRRSEERYRALASVTAQIVWTCDRGGRWHEPSPTWEAFTGQSAAQTLDYGYMEAIPLEDRQEFQIDREYAERNQQPMRSEHRIRRRDGVLRRMITRAVPLFEEDGVTVREWVGACTDITEQREAAAALRESEERYEAISSMTSDYAFSYRLEQDGRLRLEWITDAFTDISGYSAADLERLGWTGVLHTDDVARVESMTRRVLVYGQEATLEARLRTREGAVRWVRMYTRPHLGSRGVVIGFYGAAQDITEQKRAEAEANAAHQKQRRIAETLQRSLLITTEEAAFPGLTIHTEYAAAWEEAQIGGDFYDAFAVEEGKIAVFVGDVMGKGLTAAAYTAEIKFALRAFLREHRKPGLAMNLLNNFVVTSQAAEHFSMTALVCGVLAVIDSRTGETEISVAGTEPPLLLRTGHRTATATNTEGGPVLGIIRGATYPSATVTLNRNDLLLFFTDGLTESRAGERGERFFGPGGIASAAQCVIENRPTDTPTLADIGRAILTAAQSFSRTGALTDDACLLLVRRS